MGAFEYQALDPDSRTRRGVIQADNARQARQNLRERGLIPLAVDPVETRRGAGRALGSGNRRERALLLRQMASLLQAGLPLEEVLSVLVEQAEAAALRRQLGSMRARVMEGQSLSQAMAEHPRLFPHLYTAAIAAGERAGRLQPVLDRLASHAELTEATSRSIGMALVYPVLLVITALAVVWGLVGFVVPRVVGVFEQAYQDLPLMTRSLLVISDTIAEHGWLLIGLLVALVVLGALVWRQPGPRRRMDGIMLGLPLAGRMVRARQTATFTRTLAILVASAVPLVEALRVTAGVMGNQVARADVERAADRVREGVSLSQALNDARWLPPMARRLIHGGERSGELAPMLDHAAAIQERDLEAVTVVLLGILQPVLILIVGLVVLYIVLAIMLPILSLSQLLQ